MYLVEFDKNSLDTAYYDPSLDKLKQRHLDDTRKPKLMLKHLNKLKKMRALSKLEKLKRQDLLGIMYGEPAGGEEGGLGGLGGGGGLPPPPAEGGGGGDLNL
jgi:hypothetical protein